MFFLRPECALLRLAAAAVKAPDELAVLGLAAAASQTITRYPSKGKHQI